MAGIVENILCSSALADSSAVHNNNLIGHLRDNAQIMGNDDDRHAQLLLQFHHQLQDLCLDRNVKCGGGLVRDQDRGLGYQRHSNHDTLAHTAGQLVRILFETAGSIVDTYQLQHLLCFLPCVLFADFIVCCDGFHDLVSHRVDGIEGGHGILEDHSAVSAAEVFHLLGSIFGNILSLEQYFALCDVTVSIQNLHDGIRRDRFAGTGLAYDTKALALFQCVGNTVNCLDFSLIGLEGSMKVNDLQKRCVLFCILTHGLPAFLFQY